MAGLGRFGRSLKELVNDGVQEVSGRIFRRSTSDGPDSSAAVVDVDAGTSQQHPGEQAGVAMKPRLVRVLRQLQVRGGGVEEEFAKLPPESYTETLELRVATGTWNLNGRKPPDELDISEWLDPKEDADIYVAGFQEIVPLNTQNVLADGFQREIAGMGSDMAAATLPWEALIGTALNDPTREGLAAPKWVPLCRKQMVGVYMSVWVRGTLRAHVHEVAMTAVGCGVMGVLGNKGGVLASMRVYDTFLCLACTHLSSGQAPGDAAKRSADFQEIVKRTEFSVDDPFQAAGPGGVVRRMAEHDHCIWVGDLNYRLDMEDAAVRRLISMGDWGALLSADQLVAERAAGRAFGGWEEGQITFPPTYKLRRGTVGEYCGDVGGGREEGEKSRTPAWCDRILWTPCGGIKALNYVAVPGALLSDHKPVLAVFAVPFLRYPVDKVADAVASARRAADASEMASRPQCRIDKTAVDFGHVRYGEGVSTTLVLTNEGQVAGDFKFLPFPEGGAAYPPWVALHPAEGRVAAGQSVDVAVRAGVAGAGAGAVTEELAARQGSMDCILVLRVEGGRDFFVTLAGTYEVSCWGLPLESLPEARAARASAQPFGAAAEAQAGRAKPPEGSIAGAGEEEGKKESKELKEEAREAVVGKGEEEGEEEGVHRGRAQAGQGEAVGPLKGICPAPVADLLAHAAAGHGITLLICPSPAEEASRGTSAVEASPDEVAAVRRAIDDDDAVPESATGAAAFKALLELFEALPTPLLPQAVVEVCDVCVPPTVGAANSLLEDFLSPVARACFLEVVAAVRGALAGAEEMGGDGARSDGEGCAEAGGGSTDPGAGAVARRAAAARVLCGAFFRPQGAAAGDHESQACAEARQTS